MRNNVRERERERVDRIEIVFSVKKIFCKFVNEIIWPCGFLYVRTDAEVHTGQHVRIFFSFRHPLLSEKNRNRENKTVFP